MVEGSQIVFQLHLTCRRWGAEGWNYWWIYNERGETTRDAEVKSTLWLITQFIPLLKPLSEEGGNRKDDAEQKVLMSYSQLH